METKKKVFRILLHPVKPPRFQTLLVNKAGGSGGEFCSG
jgi:hypothetical protein